VRGDCVAAGMSGKHSHSLQCIFRRDARVRWMFGSIGRGGGIRTPDPLLPKQMRYQTALRPDSSQFTASQPSSLHRTRGLISMFIPKIAPNTCMASHATSIAGTITSTIRNMHSPARKNQLCRVILRGSYRLAVSRA
jgi:hypothetical protein